MSSRTNRAGPIRLRDPGQTPEAVRSWWLQEALRADPGEPAETLSGRIRTDVAIVGGGYTGLWTAYHLKQTNPGVDVTLIEADICGAGPSGRNGGFLGGLWQDFGTLVHLFGAEQALNLAATADACIHEACSLLRRSGIDVWLQQTGHICVSTSTVHDASLSNLLAALRDMRGLPDGVFTPLSPKEVSARCRSPRFRGGILYPRGCTVQPARLARGLRRLIMARGVHVFERTPVLSLTPGRTVRLTTPRGEIVADHAVLGINTWMHQVPGFGRKVVPRASHIVLTEPAPDRLREIGWLGGEGIFDLRASLNYLRTTPDGRIAFGAATGDAARTVKTRFSADSSWRERLQRRLGEWFPPFDGVAIDAAWGGPVDVSPHHLPFFGSLYGGNVHFGVGFAGAGVGPSVLGGRILSALALERTDQYSSLPLVNYPLKRFPPQPFRSLGAHLTRAAIVRTDDARDRGRPGNGLTRGIARLPRRLGYNLGTQD